MSERDREQQRGRHGGRHFWQRGDTYNPEPQWLQQDRDYQQQRDYQLQRERAERDRGAQREDRGWEEDDLDFGRRRYEPFRVGTGMGLAPGERGEPEFGQGYGHSSGYARHESGYGSRAGWDLGTHQRDIAPERVARQTSYRGLGPQDYKRTDERIRDDICERLTDSHDIDARNILVEVHQGNVTLSGTVIERRMRYAAEDLVERVGGVANINNQMRVQSPQERTGQE
jgi:hypothetical protein